MNFPNGKVWALSLPASSINLQITNWESVCFLMAPILIRSYVFVVVQPILAKPSVKFHAENVLFILESEL
jgi:hypothetical protein